MHMALRDPNAVCMVCGQPYWVAKYKLAKSRFCGRACQAVGRTTSAISQDDLARLYYGERLSMQQIAGCFGCSLNKVVYWMDRYGFERRGWSDATYVYRNPDGDPFTIRTPETPEEKELFALAIGLYMGEGSKKSAHTVALANANPAILRIFIAFLDVFCGVSRSDVKAWLNIFDDCDVEEATKWWTNELGLYSEQFYSTTIRQSRDGNYTKKSEFGTLSISFANTKLKKIIDNWCDTYYDRFSAISS